MFIWETVDEKVLLVVSEHDKEYDFLSRFILHEVFVTGSEDEIHLIVISENEVELLTNALLWTPVELAKQHLILLLETVKLWGIDLLTGVEIEVESLHKKWSFPLQISSVNVTKSAVSCGFGLIYWRNL